VKRSDPPVIKTMMVSDKSFLTSDEDDGDAWGGVWRLSYQSFTIKELRQYLADEWSIPIGQLTINCRQRLDPKTRLRLPEGVSVKWPARV
jgi:hypothetical protein